MATARTMRRIKPAQQQTTTVTITLELNDEHGAPAIRTFSITPSKLPLIFVEALEDLREDGSWRNMRRGIQKLLKLTDAEADELETDHIVQIAEAIQEATDIPNG